MRPSALAASGLYSIIWLAGHQAEVAASSPWACRLLCGMLAHRVCRQAPHMLWWLSTQPDDLHPGIICMQKGQSYCILR